MALDIISITISGANPITVVTTKKTFTVTQTQIDNYLAAHPSATDAELEANLEAYLNSQDNSFDYHIHIYSRNPADIGTLFAETGTTVNSNWWARKGS